VIITGSSQPPQSSCLQLSTAALRGIKTYAPHDLYITVGSGTPLVEIQDFLARENKQLALSSPWPGTTIGGLVASNTNAPQRMRYGAVRDNVLCATVALADGRVIRTGRPIVKNVAGYDITKPFIGSYGTLGLLTDISLKIIARPRMQRTLLVPVQDLADGLRWGQEMLTLALLASSILLSKGYQISGVPHSNYLLSYTVEGMPDDVLVELAQVRAALKNAGSPEPLEVEDVSGTAIWAALLNLPTSTVVRVGIPAKDLSTYVQHTQVAFRREGSFIADFASGFVYAVRPDDTAAEINNWLAAVRGPALERTGYAVVMAMPAELQGQVDMWGYRPEGVAIMRRLKDRWDAKHVLNPDVFSVDTY
jgi:FAD/FMN-containing dehydrogenase